MPSEVLKRYPLADLRKLASETFIISQRSARSLLAQLIEMLEDNEKSEAAVRHLGETCASLFERAEKAEAALKELENHWGRDKQLWAIGIERANRAEAELATAHQRIAELEKAVIRYGRHDSDCGIYRQTHRFEERNWEEECTCGYWRYCAKGR
jgi:hypothetical protein